MTLFQGLRAALHLCCIFLFCAVGLFLVGLSFAPEIRLRALERLFYHPEPCLWGGIAFLGVGVLYAFGLWLAQKGGYWCLKMGRHRAEISVSILKESVEELLKKHFPQIEVDIVRRKQLEIAVLIPGEKTLDQFEAVEKPLSEMLKEKFGYTDSFSLIVKNPLA
jgi:hypothetical protein